MEFDSNKEYMIDGGHMTRLAFVMGRLYNDRRLSGDERRDLANIMDVVLHGAVAYKGETADE